MIKKYKSKPKIIEAVQFDGHNQEEIDVFCEGGSNTYYKLAAYVSVRGNTMAFRLHRHDYLIKSDLGLYPCKPEIFEASYEEVTDE